MQEKNKIRTRDHAKPFSFCGPRRPPDTLPVGPGTQATPPLSKIPGSATAAPESPIKYMYFQG